jgi:spermidine/putrescine transport system permease protein
VERSLRPSGIFRLIVNRVSLRRLRGMRRVNLTLGLWTILVFLFLYGPIAVLIVYSFNSGTYGAWEGYTGKWYAAFWAHCMSDLQHWLGGAGERLFGWMSGSLGGVGFLDRWAASAPWWPTQKLLDFVGWAGADNAAATLKTVPPRIRGQIPRLVEGFSNSLLVGGIATVLSTLLGTISAWITFKYKYPLRRLLTALVAVPMIVPEIIMGVSFLVFISVVGGLLQRIGVPLGRGYLAIIIAHVTFSFPFVMVTIQARLAGIDPALEEAAMDLGATPAQAFRKVIVPYLLPAIVSGVLMAFTLSLDDFIVTYFVSDGASETLPIRIYGQIKYSPPMLHVVSTIMVGLTVALVTAAEIIKRVRR